MNPPYIIGSFQYFRLYIWPPPGITRASHSARWGLGRHVAQSRFAGALTSASAGNSPPIAILVSLAMVVSPAASAFSMLWAMESVVALAWLIRMDIESLYTATESVAPRALATESAVAVASAVATGATACATTGCACAAIIMQMAAMRIADIMIVRLNFRPGYLFQIVESVHNALKVFFVGKLYAYLALALG